MQLRLHGAALAALVLAGPAHACTLCHTSLAEQVRLRLFAPDFAGNAAALTLAIAAVVAGVAVAIRKV